MPTLSVIIPTYNGGAFVEQTLQSVFRQTLPPDELIVVDDCSSDATVVLVQQALRGSPIPARLLATNRNTGSPAHPINLGLRAARGELVSVLDQDDIYLPARLARLTQLLVAAPRASFAVCACRVFVGRPFLRIVTRSCWNLRRLAKDGEPVAGGAVVDGAVFLAALVSSGNFVLGYPGFLFRRSAAMAAGGADESLLVASDYDLLCRLSASGDVCVAPQVLYLRREHLGNLSRAAPLACARDALDVIRRYSAMLDPRRLDARFWAQRLERQYLWLLSQLGWGGLHKEARRRLRLAMSDWGITFDSVFTAGKLLASWTTSGRVTRPACAALVAEVLAQLESLRHGRNAKSLDALAISRPTA